MSAKQIEVQKWLIDVFGDAEIPSFDKTEQNVETLYHLMQSHSQAHKDVNVVNNFKEARTENYVSLTHHISKVLNAINFTPSSLKGNDRKCFDALTNLCDELNLESPQLTNTLLGINDLENKSLSINAALERERKQTDQLLKLSQDTARKLEDIKSVTDEAMKWKKDQVESIHKEEKKKEFSITKSHGYTSEIQRLENRLRQSGYSEEVSHDALLEKMQKIESLEKEYNEAISTLDSYVLPHDMTLAKLKVEEAKNYLDTLMKKG